MTTAATRIWTFATVILIVVIVALGWFLGVSPKVSEIARAEAEFVTVQAQNELNRIALAQIEDDFARLGEYREELDEIRVEFPELPEYDSVTSKILAELGSAGLVLDTLSISEPAPSIPDVTVNEFGQLPPGTLVSLNITISASGTLLSALDFISAM